MSRLPIIPDENSLELETRLNTIAKELELDDLINLFDAEGVFLSSAIDQADDLREIQIWGKSPTCPVKLTRRS